MPKTLYGIGAWSLGQPRFCFGGFDSGEEWHPELEFVKVGIVEHIPREFGVAGL